MLSCIIPSSGEKTEAHQLTASNNGKLPVTMYVELDLDLLGVIVLKAGVCITQEPNELLDDDHKTKLAGDISWNLIKLAYQCLSTNLDKRAWKILTV